MSILCRLVGVQAGADLTARRALLGRMLLRRLRLVLGRGSSASPRLGSAELRGATSRLPMVVFTLDRHGRFTMAEGHGLERIGLRPGAIVGESIFERWSSKPEVTSGVRRALAGETVTVNSDLGARSSFETTYAPLREASGVIEGVVAIGLDMTERNAARRELERASWRDALTGLPNRTGLMRRLEAALPAARHETALLLLDLDRFKEVNDAIGHAAGDELLRGIGERVFAFLGVRHQAGRLGGDEFAIVAPDTDERGASVLARTISDAIRAPFTVNGQELYVTASMGIAVAPRDGLDAPTLLRKAEVAMYDAKRRGAAWALYAPASDEPSAALLSLTSDLRHAIEDDELTLAFQPIVDCATGTVLRFEALARWPRRDRDVPPSEFIPLAERVGLLTALTDWVIAASVRQLKTWLQSGLDARVTVNLTPRNLLEPDLPRRIAAALAAAEVPAERLGIEVTESTIMTDPERASRTIAELRDLAIPIAVDDFGTGHSSLAYLNQLPISTVKIDKSLVRGIRTSESAREIVRATIRLAHALDFTVVAEGIEDAETLDLVRSFGCDQVQGFHVARPASAVEASLLLRAR